MSEATELLLMAYKLLHKPMNNGLTRTNAITQQEITMSDGSILTYNIDITVQTNQEFSIAYQKIKDITHREMIEPIELSIVHMFSDCPDDEEEGDGDMLTADDYPECAE